MDLPQMIKLIAEFGVSLICSRACVIFLLYFNEKFFKNSEKSAASINRTKSSAITAYYGVGSI